MTDFITTKEAGRIIGVSPSTVGLWIQSGQLEGKKVNGRWLLRREVAEEKAATHTPTLTDRNRIFFSTRPSAKAGAIDHDTIARAKETVIAHWSEGIPEAAARRWFAELLEDVYV